MKLHKLPTPFSFKDKTHQEVVDIIDKEYPINLVNNQDLIDRIHAKCPFITKPEISIVVKQVFTCWRELLILGNVLNFNTLFFDCKLNIFKQRRKLGISNTIEVKMSTPPPLRKL